MLLEAKMRLIESAWELLGSIEAVNFELFSATSGEQVKVGWGAGRVMVQHRGSDQVVLEEQGRWETPAGQSFRFSNAYRWTRAADYLQIEHVRRGAEHPVYLLALEPVSADRLQSRSPHICGADLYKASVRLGGGLVVEWQVEGPKKQDRIVNKYQAAG